MRPVTVKRPHWPSTVARFRHSDPTPTSTTILLALLLLAQLVLLLILLDRRHQQSSALWGHWRGHMLSQRRVRRASALHQPPSTGIPLFDRRRRRHGLCLDPSRMEFTSREGLTASRPVRTIRRRRTSNWKDRLCLQQSRKSWRAQGRCQPIAKPQTVVVAIGSRSHHLPIMVRSCQQQRLSVESAGETAAKHLLACAVSPEQQGSVSRCKQAW